MDLGWHLTSCDAEPLKQIKNKKFVELLKILIDPSWGLAPTTRINSLARALGLPNPGALSLGDALGEAIITSNDLNRRIKHGRQIIMQNFKPQLGAVLPFIQIEPGQKPLDILKTYCARMGWLLNVGAQGEIIFFRPRFDTDPLYTLHFHSTRAEERTRNNIIGRPTIRTSLAERYSEVQTWSTVVIPPEIQNTENPNEMYRHSSVKASPNPVPFFRRHIVNDGEAINDQLRKNRATWEMQLGMFNAETYEAEFPAHSQDGAKFVSDTMISMNDTIHKWEGAHYVSSVHRSDTLRDGPRSRLTIHRPGLLNPELTALDVGGGARKALGK
jgi:hypothetical protein